VRQISELVTQTGADVVHANGEKMAVLGRWSAHRTQRPCVAWLHDEPVRSAPAAGLAAAMLAAPRARNVVPSQWLADRFHHRLRMATTVIPLGIDLDILPTDGVDVRAVAGWDRSTTVLGHFGRLQRWKGADLFLRAAARTVARHPDARFVVVGGALYGWETEYAASLPTLAAELGISDRVYFAGHRDDALAMMRGCDVVVHSSRRGEPFGLVIVEAMALGRAVIASRSGGPEEIVAHGHTGLLVERDDVAALADAMDDLAGDPTRRAALAVAGEAAARQHHSADVMAATFADLYDEVTRTPQRVGS